jgi:hypothetical protein
MDHIQGLGFFGVLQRPDFEVHIWGPASTTLDLSARRSRYLSPPLFPVRMRDLDCGLIEVGRAADFEVGDFVVRSRSSRIRDRPWAIASNTSTASSRT